MSTLNRAHSREQQHQALKTAGQWYAQLCSGSANSKDEQALKNWLTSNELHAWAWSRVDQLQQQLERMPGSLAIDTLDRTEQHFCTSRRNILKSFALLAGSGILGWNGYRQGTLDPLLADHYTSTGEVKSLTLPDGSTLTLNAASSIDIQFTLTERRIVLRQGELMIQTAKDAAATEQARPFIVQTSEGDVRALGTRFSVRTANSQTQNNIQVSVYQHSVEITALSGSQRYCDAGQTVAFNAQIINKPSHFSSQSGNSDAWTKNMLVVENMPLDTFLAELSRYRSGVLHCDPAVAHHRISGAFHINDTDQALRAVEKSFPVSVNYRTQYWVSVTR